MRAPSSCPGIPNSPPSHCPRKAGQPSSDRPDCAPVHTYITASVKSTGKTTLLLRPNLLSLPQEAFLQLCLPVSGKIMALAAATAAAPLQPPRQGSCLVPLILVPAWTFRCSLRDLTLRQYCTRLELRDRALTSPPNPVTPSVLRLRPVL